ncbi:uncharacterized protein LOC120358311 [Solenopsis invicta]|uniref:uncharacterized protein LOC120358311 n=1 Tax=Solenopsis invicta TaxID=13686 RepID=UPI00193D83C2|nr:uncharacterized protein LOC120358311 [Solenopsis invicta]
MAEKRVGNISNGQRKILIEFLNNHPELVSAKFTSTFSYKDAQKLWCEITNILNALPGAKKTWEQWRKTWHDMKNKVKGKKADINQSLKKTGEGPPSEINMTMIDNDVANLIGPTTIYGDATVDESIAEFNFENTENTEIENTLGFKENNSDISTASRNNNILKDITYKRNVDLNTKKCVQVKSSINCNKELLISKSQSVEPCVFISDESVNGQANEDTNINNTKLKNQNIKSTITTAVTHKGIKKCRQNTSHSQQRTTKKGYFENTLSYTKCLSTNMENDMKMREEYYNKKLKFMERDVIAKERIAAAIETFYAINQENITYEEVENLEDTGY